MIDVLNRSDYKKLEALEAAAEAELSTLDEEIKRLRPDEPFSPKGIGAAEEGPERVRLFNEWEAAGSSEWRAARRRWIEINASYLDERDKIVRRAEQRAFSKLQADPEKIKENAKKQTEKLIKKRHEAARSGSEGFTIYYLRYDDEKAFLDPDITIADSKANLSLHYAFFKDDPEGTRALDGIVIDVISSSPFVRKQGTLAKRPAIPAVNLTSPKDAKVIHSLLGSFVFSGEYQHKKPRYGERVALSVGRGEQLLNYVVVSNASMNKDEGERIELSYFDWAVHDAVATLWLEAEERAGTKITRLPITPGVLWRTMTFSSTDRLTKNNRDALMKSLKRMRANSVNYEYGPDFLQAMQYDEVSFKLDAAILSVNLLTELKVRGQEIGDGIMVNAEPPLLFDARLDSGGTRQGRYQITPVPGSIFNIPNMSDNVTTITLKRMLVRYILPHKGKSKPAKTALNTISYSRIYEEVERATGKKALSPGAQRKEQMNIRNKVHTILDHFEEENFISSYGDNIKGKQAKSVTFITPEMENRKKLEGEISNSGNIEAGD